MLFGAWHNFQLSRGRCCKDPIFSEDSGSRTSIMQLILSFCAGPAAIQRMRMEVEGVSKDPSERRRRSMSRSGSNLDISAVNDAMQEVGHDGHTHEARMLAERVVAMDEEMKMLKDALSQRNGEVQSARLMCSKATTQLSVVEEELRRAKYLNGIASHLI